MAERPPAHTILRALRDVRGLTQSAWADRLGYSSASLRRWESGAAVLSAQAEAALIACCREDDLFRAYEHGPLGGMLLTPEVLKDALAEARLQVAGLAAPADRARPPTATDNQSVSGERTNLPAQLPPLIGREAELTLLRERIRGDRAPLLTLTGPGGVGKTRLALRLGKDLLGSFSGGVWLVEFASLGDPELLAGAAAVVFGVQEQAGRSLHQGLIELLQPRAALLIFDNCEHLVGACAALAGQLLAACPSLRILATSREPLRTPVETVWIVPSLATPGAQVLTIPHELQEVPSVRLFVERAQAVQPAFVLTPVNGPVIAQICARLDDRRTSGRCIPPPGGWESHVPVTPADVESGPGLECCAAARTRAGAVPPAGRLRGWVRSGGRRGRRRGSGPPDGRGPGAPDQSDRQVAHPGPAPAAVRRPQRSADPAVPLPRARSPVRLGPIGGIR